MLIRNGLVHLLHLMRLHLHLYNLPRTSSDEDDFFSHLIHACIFCMCVHMCMKCKCIRAWLNVRVLERNGGRTNSVENVFYDITHTLYNVYSHCVMRLGNINVSARGHWSSFFDSLEEMLWELDAAKLGLSKRSANAESVTVYEDFFWWGLHMDNPLWMI